MLTLPFESIIEAGLAVPALPDEVYTCKLTLLMADVSRRSRPARIAILKAARRLFEDKDFISVTLEEVARAAGVSRQAIYTNFGSRAGLLAALVAYVDEIGGLQAKIANVLSSPTAVGALEALVDFRARYTPSIYRLATHLDAARRFA